MVVPFVMREDRNGDPVAHMPGCFCPSMASIGFSKPDTWIAEAASISALAEDLEQDAIDDGLLTRGEAHAMIRIGHCIDAPSGVGRRFAGSLPTDKLGAWERGIEAKKASTTRPLPPPHIRDARMAFAETDRHPGRPQSAHAGCDHETTKAARAACRRVRAKATK